MLLEALERVTHDYRIQHASLQTRKELRFKNRLRDISAKWVCRLNLPISLESPFASLERGDALLPSPKMPVRALYT